MRSQHSGSRVRPGPPLCRHISRQIPRLAIRAAVRLRPDTAQAVESRSHETGRHTKARRSDISIIWPLPRPAVRHNLLSSPQLEVRLLAPRLLMFKKKKKKKKKVHQDNVTRPTSWWYSGGWGRSVPLARGYRVSPLVSMVDGERGSVARMQ